MKQVQVNGRMFKTCDDLGQVEAALNHVIELVDLAIEVAMVARPAWQGWDDIISQVGSENGQVGISLEFIDYRCGRDSDAFFVPAYALAEPLVWLEVLEVQKLEAARKAKEEKMTREKADQAAALEKRRAQYEKLKAEFGDEAGQKEVKGERL